MGILAEIYHEQASTRRPPRFRARCLACLGEIEQSEEPITITRRGRPVAVLGPVKHGARKSPRHTWARRDRIVGDIVNPDMPALWEAAGLQ